MDSTPVNGALPVGLKPGLVIVVPVVKIDGCVGQSFIRFYATLTRVTDESDEVLSYVGVTKAV